MLRLLRIKNLAVIDAAELELGPGFICLTGESGAGKSVLLESLLLLAGGRASLDLLRTGADKALVEAEFELDQTDSELELLDGKTLYLRRELTKDGKSRAFVNGALVPANLMAAYGDLAFEIHGQHGQQRLLKEKNHLAIFDAQTGLSERETELARLHRSFATDFAHYWELRDNEALRLRELDFIRMQIMEIQEVAPREDDLELEHQLKRARNGEQIRANREELAELLSSRILPDLKKTERLLNQLARFETNLEPYREQVTGLSATLADLGAEMEVQDERDDPAQLAKLELRESALNKLFMKYGRDIPEVLLELKRLMELRDQLAADSEGLDARWLRLEQAYQHLLQQLKALHAARETARTLFEAEVQATLDALNLRHSRFTVENPLPDWPATLPKKRDFHLAAREFRFLFSANPGEPPKPMSKVASGGELSRVLLALIASCPRESGKLLVFDEIDAGLGGETAHAVGMKLAHLGQQHQVLCVTHFAQVARFAQSQIKIEKRTEQDRTFTSLSLCDYEQRVAELARLMGGDSQAENLRDHARQLIGSPAYTP